MKQEREEKEVTKKEFRRKAENIRDSIPAHEKQKLDVAIQNHLLSWKLFKEVHYIFCYVSFRSEVNTHPIIKKAIDEGKTVAVPKIEIRSGEIKAYIIESMEECLEPGAFGILEAKSDCREMDYSKLELIIAPGFAFTMRGDRLGYGGGFYDRFLKKYNGVPVCGLTYDCLIFDYLPVKEHDSPVDYLITESGVKKTLKGN